MPLSVAVFPSLGAGLRHPHVLVCTLRCRRPKILLFASFSELLEKFVLQATNTEIANRKNAHLLLCTLRCRRPKILLYDSFFKLFEKVRSVVD